MALFPNQKITIILEGDEDVPEPAPVAPLLPWLRPGSAHYLNDEYSPYLLRQQKKTGFIFFDLARVRNPDYDPGNSNSKEFVDFNFLATAAIEVVTQPNPPNAQDIVIGQFTTAQREALKNKLLLTEAGQTLFESREQLKSETSDFLYTDIELYDTTQQTPRRYALARNNSRQYLYSGTSQNPGGVEILPADDNKWEDDRLLAKSGKHLRVLSYCYYEPFDTGDTENFKLTEGDFSDAAVIYNAQAGETKVFLTPRMFRESVYARGSYLLVEQNREYGGDLTGPFYYKNVTTGFAPFLRFGADGVGGFVQSELYGTGITQANNREIVSERLYEYYGPSTRIVHRYNTPQGSQAVSYIQLATINQWASIAGQWTHTRNGRNYFLENVPVSVSDPSNSYTYPTQPATGQLVGVLQQKTRTYYVYAKQRMLWSEYRKGLASEQIGLFNIYAPETNNVWNLR